MDPTCSTLCLQDLNFPPLSPYAQSCTHRTPRDLTSLSPTQIRGGGQDGLRLSPLVALLGFQGLPSSVAGWSRIFEGALAGYFRLPLESHGHGGWRALGIQQRGMRPPGPSLHGQIGVMSCGGARKEVQGEEGTGVGCVCRDAEGFSEKGRGAGYVGRAWGWPGQAGIVPVAHSLQGGPGKHRFPWEVRGTSWGGVRPQAEGDPLGAWGAGLGSRVGSPGCRRAQSGAVGHQVALLSTGCGWPGPRAQAGARPQLGAREGPSVGSEQGAPRAA